MQRDRLDVSDYCRLIVESGRAAVYPIYQGMHERGEGGRENYLDSPNVYPDLVVQWSKDLGRTLDYLETRSEFDSRKVAFLGFSLGGIAGSILPAMEPRLKVNILIAGGIRRDAPRNPRNEQVNFAPRISIPTLMVNGRYDFIFSEPSQRELFGLLGTPDEHKRHVLLNLGHFISAQTAMPEANAWLDRYLGPVR
jgi:dienelactone hydrolase